jgi:putative transposase
MNGDIYKEYLHTPPHLFRPHSIYMVTGGTLKKRSLLDSDSKKEHFLTTLIERTRKLAWELEAWAILPNHYHIIARAPENAGKLKTLIQSVHSISGKHLNQQDNTPGRRTWYNYWDTCITFERSYMARLNYVHVNPVKHGLVERADDYPYCSYRWFVERADPVFRDRVLSHPIDRLRVMDDF